MLQGPWVAIAPLIALIVVLVWPYAGRVKLTMARARLRKASARAARLRAQHAAQAHEATVRHQQEQVRQAHEATVRHQQEQVRQAHEANRRLEALRAINRAVWNELAPKLSAALDVANILLAQHGSLSLQGGPARHGPGPEFGIPCAIIAHDRSNSQVGSLAVNVDDGFVSCVLLFAGGAAAPVRVGVAGLAVAEVTNLLLHAMHPVLVAEREDLGFRPAPEYAFAEQRFA